MPFMELTYQINTKVYRAAIGSFFFLSGLTFSSWASRIPDIKTKLILTEAQLGLVLFALPVGQMISLPLSTFLINRFGSRSILTWSGYLYPILLLPLAFAGSIFQLVIGLLVFGLFANMLNICMNTQAIGVEKLFGRSIMASFHGMWSLAGFSGAFAGTLLVSLGLSPFEHFSIIASFCILLVLIFSRYTLSSDGEREQKQPFFTKPDRSILLLGFIAFCCMVCEGAMADWSGVYFQKIVEVPAAYVTLGYTAFMGTMATGRFLGDILVTKFGRVRLLQISGILIASGLSLSILIPQIWMATAGFLLVGFGVSSVVPIVYGMAGKVKNRSASAALAAISTISFLGFLLGPPVFGFIAQLSSLQWSFAIVALLGLGTTVLSGKLKRVLGKDI